MLKNRLFNAEPLVSVAVSAPALMVTALIHWILYHSNCQTSREIFQHFFSHRRVKEKTKQSHFFCFTMEVLH